MFTEPTHREVWAGALLSFALFVGLFVAGEVGSHSLWLFLRLVALGLCVALVSIGWSMREREKDEPIFDLIVERERRLMDEGPWRDAA